MMDAKLGLYPLARLTLLRCYLVFVSDALHWVICRFSKKILQLEQLSNLYMLFTD